MSELPKGWAKVNLFDLCTPKQWKTISINELKPSGYTVYGANGIIGFYDIFTHTDPTIMITCRGATCGNIHVSKPFSYINGNAMALDDLEKNVCLLDYLKYFLFNSNFNNIVSGSAQPQITQANLKKLFISVPPLNEQTRIVAKLEELFSDLDAGVSELKTAQAKLVQYRQSLLKAAVEGELSRAWRESRPIDDSDETGARLLERILTERRKRWEQKQLARFAEQDKQPPKDWQKKYPEPIQPDTSSLPKLPNGWVWASLDQVSDIQGGIQKKPSRTPVKNKYPFLRVANVYRAQLKLDDIHEIELLDGELERLALVKGDILIVEGNGSLKEIGRCAVWNGSIANAVHQNHLIRSRPLLMESDFVETWLNSFKGIEYMTKLAATTSGLYTLSVGKIAQIPIPVPSLNEQVKILEILQNQLEQEKAQTLVLEKSLKQSAAQRKNILRAAFAGELVAQDPNDEPASELLARIQAERQAQIPVSKNSTPKTRKAASKQQGQLPLEG